MRARLTALALVGACGGVAAGPSALARPARRSGPTRAQIAAAATHAEHSSELWATINVCNTPQARDIVGVRGQMPGLGFVTRMRMTVAVEYYSSATRRFVQTGTPRLIDLGRSTVGVHQGGVRFPFRAPPPGEHWTVRGVVDFSWWLGSRRVAHALRHTRHGQRHVDFGDPAGYSAGICQL